MPFWQTSRSATCAASSSSGSSSTSSGSRSRNNSMNGNNGWHAHRRSSLYPTSTVSLVAKSLLPPRRRLRLDPPDKLYFPYEPGKQVRSAIGIKNISKSHVAFKFQTTAPKSCYMRPPGAVLAPGQILIAAVFKFVEPPERCETAVDEKRSRVKFKIMSLKVKGEMDYAHEMFDEHKDQVAVEQILRVTYLDPDSPCPALRKLKRQLAEAEAELETRKKRPPEETRGRGVGEGLVIDEWMRHSDIDLWKTSCIVVFVRANGMEFIGNCPCCRKSEGKGTWRESSTYKWIPFKQSLPMVTFYSVKGVPIQQNYVFVFFLSWSSVPTALHFKVLEMIQSTV